MRREPFAALSVTFLRVQLTPGLHQVSFRFRNPLYQKLLLLGSDIVDEEALIRFYLLHVMILPLALAALMSVHFWRIRKDGGLAGPQDADRRLGPPDLRTQPVFTEAPQKTYSLAALVRGRTPAVGRGPENTLPSLPCGAGVAALLGLPLEREQKAFELLRRPGVSYAELAALVGEPVGDWVDDERLFSVHWLAL